MFLKHQDVKQKNWRMRKVKKVFVSSCMLLTVGLGVAVPTAFSQSNGVMVVKAAEVSEEVSKLPTVSFVKQNPEGSDTSKRVLWGPEVDKTYSKHAAGSDQRKYYDNDVKAPVLRVGILGSSTNGGVEISAPVYSNTNYTLRVNLAHQMTWVRLGYKGAVKTGEYYEKTKSNKLYTHEMRLVTSNKKHVYQGEGSEGKLTMYVYRDNRVDGKNNSAAIIKDAILVPDTPKLVPQNKELELKLSKVENKSIQSIVNEIPEVSKILDSLVTDSAHFNNPVKSTWSKIDNPDKVITTVDDSFVLNYTAEKWGQNTSGKVTVRLIEDRDYKKDIDLAKQSLLDIKKKTIKQIDLDNWLSDDEKRDQTSEVERTYTEGESEINKAKTLTTIHDVLKKYSTEGNNISIPDQYKKGKKEAKVSQEKEKLQSVYDTEKNKIVQDKWSSTSQKQEEQRLLDSVKTEAENNLSETNSLQDLLSKSPSEQDKLRKIYKGNKEQKVREDGLKNLKKTLLDTQIAIKEDNWLSNGAKKMQLTAAQKAFEKGAKELQNSQDFATHEEKFNNYVSKDTEKHPDSIPNQYIPGNQEEIKSKEKVNLKKVYDDTISNINQDNWLSDEDKQKQTAQATQAYENGIQDISSADSLINLKQVVEKSVGNEDETSIPNKHIKGDQKKEVDSATQKLQEIHKKTQDAIETDPWLSPEQKKAQKENAKARLDAGLKAVEITESLDKLKEVESDFLDKEKNPDSIPNQHKAGTPEVARKTFLDNFEKEAKKEIESIDKDDTLTANAKQVAKDKVAQQLQEATAKVEKAQSFDDLKKVETEFVTALPHTKGEKLNQQQTEAISGLEGVQKATEKAISEDKTLSKDEKKKQIADSKERLKSDTQKVKDAKNADAIKKAFEEGKVNIPQAHIPGDLNKDKEKLLAELKQKADDTEKAIDSDKTLTAKEKEEQKAKTKEELQKATEAVGAIDNREELDKKVPELKKAIEDTHVKGNLEGVKNKAIEDLKKVHDETVAKINGDDTLDKATKEAQVKEADKALEAGKEAITKADDADKVGAAVTEHTPKIKAAHKTGDLKKSQEEANTALDKAAEKERGEINKDATLTTEDKAKQLKEVETALTKAKAKVAEAKTADAINDARDKGVATIDAVHKAGQDLGARKSGQVAKLEEAAKATKDKISADPTLTSKEKEEQSKAVDAELKKAIEAVNAADTADKVDDALGKGVTDIKNQHKTGDPVVARREAHGKQLDRVAQETKDAIEKDPTLTTEEKAKQVKDVDAAKERGMAKLNEAKDADALDKAYGDGVTSIKNQHKSGDPIEARRGLHNKSIDEVAQATKDAITADTTLTEAEKETQRGNVDKEATKAKEELAKTKDADALDKAYGDGVTSIKNQHKSGKGLDVRKDEHKKALEAVAKRVTTEIEADPTLTPEVREQQKAEVQKELELATDKIAEAKDADEADKAYGDGVTAIENAHVIGKGIEARKDLAKKDLAEAVAKTKALIIEDKTLTDDQRKEQLSGVDTEYAKGIENIDAAKDAAGVDKAYSDGVRDILAQYKEGQSLDDRRNAAKEFLLKEADKVTKLINDDPTLTHDQKVDQINKVEQAKLDAIKSVDDAQTADAINDALGKGIENINNQYQHGDGVDVRKATAKGDLEKEAAKVKALIAKDPTLTQADKDKQTAAVDAAKNTAIAAVDKATTADGVNQELGKGITAINKAYRPGEGVKARKEAAKADLEKEAAKVKALIAKDPTLTQADKGKQTAAVDAAKNTAIAAVDKATTAEGINQELGKGITAINKAYRPGEGVKARKEAAKADLEKEAAKVKALITNDPTLTKADKAKQTEAVAKALKAAIAAVDKATTAEGINQELGKGITAINKAYRPGEGVKARKEAAKANLEKVAKETKALISGDRYLSETEKAVQKQAVEQVLAKALGQVEAAKTVEAVKLAENLGTVAIRSAYVAGLAKDTDQATAALNEAKQAAIEALKQAAAETLAKITTDAKLTEAQKAEQSENVSLALKTAIATVRSAQSIASVKEAKDKGITAIRAAYVPNKAVAKSSSANHLPKSGDANSIVLVGLGVMSLLLGMVLYSKKKESKD
ncbi:TPA: DUF1542 domain-containing protein [Streptococcus pyogenes]|nr:DUF1542 domain-containing protein [Streptococcus pyogenes]HEQ4472296.1 DUF1542 domain-containing protein [Streptococcus pyogenes]HER6671924.1 DUF1542 domain-containing protein [Streptococcus pyogenes]HER7715085.1 DUF1542 domain-containing protein [Streptococcus pyogenes]HER9151804.1 DUF1542 domain-containing protein [Streptococcus pyogenes]